MNRIVWLDYGKAIAIYLVLLAHTALYKPLDGFIYTFHIPFFFFISGYLFSFKKYPSYREFVKRRFNQLILPYIFINIITYLFWFFVSSRVGADADSIGNPLSPLMAAIIVRAENMLHDVPLWFLAALFVVENIYYLLYKNKKYNIIATLLLITVAFINDKYNPHRLPFCLDIAIVGTIFYAFGNYMHSFSEKVYKIIPFILSFVATIIIYNYNGRVAMHVNEYSNIILFLAGGVSGCYFMSCICIFLQKYVGTNRIVEFIASSTLLICAFHLPTFTLIKGVMFYILKLNPDTMAGTVVPNIIFATISLAVSLVIAWVVRRYLPFLTGRGFKKYSK